MRHVRNLIVALLLISSVAFSQTTVTPNNGLQVPAYGSTNWSLPLNYDMTRIDSLLSGTVPIYGLSITHDLHVSGTIYSSKYAGLDGSYFLSSNLLGAPNGVAQLDATGKIPQSSVPQPTGIAGTTITGASGTDTLLRGTSSGQASWTALMSCSGTTNALTYNTSTHLFGCNTITGGGTNPTGLRQVAIGNGTGTDIRTLTPADIGPAFSASLGCNQCGTYEAGNTSIASASGSVSYSNPSTPTSASVSDGTNVNTLSSPFTSWALSHAYTTNTCFTLTAVGNGQNLNPQPQQCINFAYYNFGGTSAGASATGATACTPAPCQNATLTGATGTLAGQNLSTTSIGQVFTLTTSGVQYYYLLLQDNVSNPGGGSFTTTGSAPQVVTFNSPITITYTNANGASKTYYLYRSTNSFFDGTTTSILVGSFLFWPFPVRRRRRKARGWVWARWKLPLAAGLSLFVVAPLAAQPNGGLQQSAHTYVPSPTDSRTGATYVVMKDANCDVSNPGTNCTVTDAATGIFDKSAPYAGTYVVTSSVAQTAARTLTIPASPGNQADVYQLSQGGFPLIVGGASGTTVSISNTASNPAPAHLNCKDGTNYYASATGSGSSVTIKTDGVTNPTQSVLNLKSGTYLTFQYGSGGDVTANVSIPYANVGQPGLGAPDNKTIIVNSSGVYSTVAAGVPGLPTGITFLAGAGTGPSTVSISGRSSDAFILSFTTGSSTPTSDGNFLSISFPSNYTAFGGCQASFVGTDPSYRALVASQSFAGFTLYGGNGSGLAANTTYTVNVLCGPSGGANGADGAPGQGITPAQLTNWWKQFASTPNLYAPATLTPGYYVNRTNGNLEANAGYSVTDYIPCNPGNDMISSIEVTGDGPSGIAFFTGDKATGYISGLGDTPIPAATPFPCPANSLFMRQTFKNSDIPAPPAIVQIAWGVTLPNPAQQWGVLSVDQIQSQIAASAAAVVAGQQTSYKMLLDYASGAQSATVTIGSIPPAPTPSTNAITWVNNTPTPAGGYAGDITTLCTAPVGTPLTFEYGTLNTTTLLFTPISGTRFTVPSKVVGSNHLVAFTDYAPVPLPVAAYLAEVTTAVGGNGEYDNTSSGLSGLFYANGDVNMTPTTLSAFSTWQFALTWTLAEVVPAITAPQAQVIVNNTLASVNPRQNANSSILYSPNLTSAPAGVTPTGTWTYSGAGLTTPSSGQSYSTTYIFPNSYAAERRSYILQFQVLSQGILGFGSLPFPNESTAQNTLINIDTVGLTLSYNQNWAGGSFSPIGTSPATIPFSMVTGQTYLLRLDVGIRTYTVTLTDPVSFSSATVTAGSATDNTQYSLFADNPVLVAASGQFLISRMDVILGVVHPAVMFLGDSITWGWTVPSAQAWARMAATHAGPTAIVSGRPGGYSYGLANRFATEVCPAQPAWAVSTIGTNDSLGALSTPIFIANVQAAINTAHACGVKVAIGLVPPNQNSSVQAYVTAYNTALLGLNADGFIYFNKALSLNRDGVSYNQALFNTGDVHPNQAGYLAMYNETLVDAPQIYY